MKVLDLCCGTKSVRKCLVDMFGEGNIQYWGVDMIPRFEPNIIADVTTWDYRQAFPSPGYFDIVWASPPCTEYSCAKSCGVRNFELADSIVKKCIEIIEFYKPKWWFIENPGSGFLRFRDFMEPLEKYRHTCTYCKYGTPYKKLTSIWTNKQGLDLKQCKSDPCDYKREHGIHRACAQSGPRKGFVKSASSQITYQVPLPLLRELFSEEQLPAPM